ncbi:hypothetical protein [Glaciibacter psychrotolerans]|uniref:Uncharacterized protein n=1 Tax=Glaciibacter psychrotolerans TaxID=670054 RepID=A0A7Z0EC27_9MICO|nr:hypothetical protein [Leifsonia psychrotolerans]NYJ18691.1 hypothetical protein [Leifsonia psychrotolerans]
MNRELAAAGTISQLLKPRRNLWQSAWVGCVVLTLPIFGSLYLLTIPHGTWVPFALAHAALVLLFALAAARLRGAGIRLLPSGIRERAYFSRMVFTPVDRIDSVIVVKLRDTYSDDVAPQLFIVDAQGRTLLRMRSQMWYPDDFTTAIHYYSVPVQSVEPVLSWAELRQSYGGNLSRWERHPVVTILAAAVVFMLVTVPFVLAVLPVIE